MQGMLYGVTIDNVQDINFVSVLTDRIEPDSFKMTRDGVIFFVRMTVWEAATYINNPRILRINVSRNAKIRQFRLTTPKLTDDGVLFEGKSLDIIFDDIDYSRVWDDTGIDRWNAATPAEIANTSPSFYTMAKGNGQISANLLINVLYSTGANRASWTLTSDPENSTGFVGLSFEFDMQIDTGWQLIIQRMNRDYTFLANIVTFTGPLFTITGAAWCGTFAACDRIHITLINNSGATWQIGPGNDNETYYVRFRNLRAVTSTTNMISTTLTVATPAGGSANKNLTVVNTARMFAGQDLIISDVANLTVSERATVVTVVSSTVVTVAWVGPFTFWLAHPIGATVKAHLIYDTEIVADLLTKLRVANSQWLNAQPLSITSLRDMRQRIWIRQTARAILRELADPIDYRYGITDDGYLYYYLRGLFARAWATEAMSLQFNRVFQSMYNAVRVRYSDAKGLPQVTAYATDEASVRTTRMTRTHTIDAQTTVAAEATTLRDASLVDTRDRSLESSLVFSRLYGLAGGEYPPDAAQEDDTITIRNVSMVIIDPALITIPIDEVRVNPETGDPELIPKAPISTLDRLLAKSRK